MGTLALSDCGTGLAGVAYKNNPAIPETKPPGFPD